MESKGSHFAQEIRLWGVQWSVAYSYRQLEDLMQERGVAADHSTPSRWVITYAPESEKQFPQRRRGDETSIRVNGERAYMYRAVNKDGQTLDFLPTP